MEETEERDASALTPGRAAPNPGPYGNRVVSGCGSGRAEIRRDRTPGKENTSFPIAHGYGRESGRINSKPWRQIGDRRACAEAAGKAAGAVVIVMCRCAGLVAVFMGTGGGRDGRGEADRATAYQGKRA